MQAVIRPTPYRTTDRDRFLTVIRALPPGDFTITHDDFTNYTVCRSCQLCTLTFCDTEEHGVRLVRAVLYNHEYVTSWLHGGPSVWLDALKISRDDLYNSWPTSAGQQ